MRKDIGPKGPALIAPVSITIVNATRCELRVTGCGSKKNIEERITKDETNSSACMNKTNKKY